MSHTQIRKVEGVLATTLSCDTISLINTQPQGKHHILRRNYSVEKRLPRAADYVKDNTGTSLFLLLLTLMKSQNTPVYYYCLV